mgnify:CR=1 FL=1
MRFLGNKLLLFGLTLFFSCQSGNEEQMNKLENSAKNWGLLKVENNDSYRYEVTGVSWTGLNWVTAITVEGGQIVSREYERFSYSNDGAKEIKENYMETGDKLGTHVNGAKLLTLDELYDVCKQEYLRVDPERNTILFTTFDNGLVSSCGYVPKGCADDCFQGFTLRVIEWLD